MAKEKGTVAQFGTKGYGFIDGDNNEKYFVHQKSIFNKSRLKTGTRVEFNTKTSDKGLVAFDVNLEGSQSDKKLSNSTIKTLFVILFILQIITFYLIFNSK